MIRERAEREDQEYETFKQRMIAAHPEWIQEISDDFESARNGEFADVMSDEEIEEAGPLDANSLEAMHDQLRSLGIAMMD